MAHQLSPLRAFVVASLRVLEGDRFLVWSEIHPEIRQLEMRDCRRMIGQLRKLGFEIRPFRTVKVRRKRVAQ